MSLRVPRWAAVVFLVALIARMAFVVLQLRTGLLDITFEAADSALYRALAESLVHGNYALESGPTAYVTPGYPAFLALLSVVGSSTLAVGMAQSVVGALSAVLAGDIARRLGGIPAAWAAGLFAALYPHLVFWTGYVLTETLYTGMVLLLLWMLARLVDSNLPRWTLGLSTGVVAAAAALVRPVVFGFALVIAGAASVAPRWRRLGLAGIAGLLLVMGPWTVRNALVLGAPVVTSTESGVVLWQGNSPGATGGSRGYVDGLDFDPLPQLDHLPEADRDAVYRREALAWMAEHPGRVAALAPRKTWNMWRPTYEGASRLNSLVTWATYPALLVAAALGLWRTRRISVGRLLWVFLAYHLVVHALITGMIRFRVPIEAVLTIPAGVALAAALAALRSRVGQGSPSA